MKIAILKTQGALHSPNIRLVVHRYTSSPELASPTLLNSNINQKTTKKGIVIKEQVLIKS